MYQLIREAKSLLSYYIYCGVNTIWFCYNLQVEVVKHLVEYQLKGADAQWGQNPLEFAYNYEKIKNQWLDEFLINMN